MRSIALSVAVAACIAAVASPAAAHRVGSGYSWVSTNGCTNVRSYLDHGVGAGEVIGVVASYYRDCSTPRSVPPGSIGLWYDYYKWNGSSWQRCYAPSITYTNGSTTHYMVYTERWTGSPWYGRPPCGAGYYGVYVYGRVNGNEASGQFRAWWSGYHYFPS
jgi:hypothetical protein